MDRQIDGRTKRTDGRIDGCMDGPTDGRTDRWTDGWIDGWKLSLFYRISSPIGAAAPLQAVAYSPTSTQKLYKVGQGYR